METFLLIGFLFLNAFYIFIAVFHIRGTIIDKLTQLFIYSDPHFANKSKYSKIDWNKLNVPKFLNKTYVLGSLINSALLLIFFPLMSGLYSVLIFGVSAIDYTLSDPYVNLRIFYITAGSCYAFAIIACVYHFLSFKKYKDKASMERNIWEARLILSKRNRK